jgi:cytochrome c oxidase subunit II
MNAGANVVEKVDFALYVIIGISTIILIGVTALMIYYAIRYSRKRNPVATQIHGDTRLEILWTVIPTILVLFMFWIGYIGYVPMRVIPEDAMSIKATGRMWSWTFEYENGTKSDKLIVPHNKSIRLELVSVDVTHALYIPAYRVKEDVTPGVNNKMWFEANRLGSFDILCAEYCGLRHSYMITKLEVLPQEEFDTWYKLGEDPDRLANPAEAGYDILRINGCIGCHSTDGTKLVGNSFKGIYGTSRKVITDGKERDIIVDDEYIHRSIYEPNADVVSGYPPGLMPAYAGQISEEDIEKIILYLKTLN